MADIDAIYQTLGVVHSENDCIICEALEATL